MFELQSLAMTAAKVNDETSSAKVVVKVSKSVSLPRKVPSKAAVSKKSPKASDGPKAKKSSSSNGRGKKSSSVKQIGDKKAAKKPSSAKSSRSKSDSEKSVTKGRATKSAKSSTQSKKATTTTASVSAKASATGSPEDEELYFHEESEKKPNYYDEKWLGNADDAGSVCSGVLEEDFCQACGLSTLSSDAWDGVVLCDGCDAEYHLNCVHLPAVPEGDFTCPRCTEELAYAAEHSFDMPGLLFQLSNKHAADDEDKAVVYTPARPLASAWAECSSKGVMVVSQVFSYDIMAKLLHGGGVSRASKAGRRTENWQGAIPEISSRLQSTGCHDLIDREGRTTPPCCLLTVLMLLQEDTISSCQPSWSKHWN